MVRISFLFILLNSLATIQAQVKEVNVLNYSLKLHGIDFRLQNNYNTYYPYLLKNIATSNQNSQSYFGSRSFLITQDPLQNFLGLSSAAVFRPFTHLNNSVLRSIEVSHGLNFEYNAVRLEDNEISSLKHSYRGFKIGYNPRLMLVSPTLFDAVKLYAGVDGYFFQPFKSELIAESLGYLGVSLNETYSLPYKQNGFGYTLGARIFASCNWNAHVEFSPKYLYTTANENTAQFYTQLIQFGARYKFGQPTDPEPSEIRKGAFW